MGRRGVLFGLLLLVSLTLVFAADFAPSDVSPPDVPLASTVPEGSIITLFDQEKQPIQDLHIHIILQEQETSKEYKFLKYATSHFIEVLVPSGNYSIIIQGDSLQTPGADYFYEETTQLMQNREYSFVLHPAGSLIGVIYDTKGNVVSGANLKFICTGANNEPQITRTDNYGSYHMDYLPVGPCHVYAHSGSEVGAVLVNVTQGTITDVNITLDKSKQGDIWGYGILVGLLILLAYLIFRHQPQKEPTKNEKTPLGKRQEDIIETLSHHEKDVVQLLLKDEECYQNKIVHTLGIPKTTLARLLQGLEAKHMITVEKVGKAKKIKLSTWFLKKK